MYTAKDGETYQLHLIDTPGHVDFTYEVSRSLAACEGALLVVNAGAGGSAQNGGEHVSGGGVGPGADPVPEQARFAGRDPERVGGEVADLIGEPAESILRSAARPEMEYRRVGGADRAVPAPSGDPDAPPRALIFDSEFDQYRGVIAYIRVVDGVFEKGEAIRAMATGTEAEIDDIGCFSPRMVPTERLSAGEVGYLITGIKDVTQLRVGDTLTTRAKTGGGAGSRAGEASEPLPGYREVKPMVFCGLFPIDSDRYPDLRDALEKLTLNDAALSWEPETSDALGFGFRCGFLGLLHMDIVKERLEREYDLELLATMPSVEFDVTLTNGEETEVHQSLGHARSGHDRGDPRAVHQGAGDRAERVCGGDHGALPGAPGRARGHALPLARAGADDLRPAASGNRARLLRSAEVAHARVCLARLRAERRAALDLVKLDVLLAGDPVDALSMVVHREKAYEIGRTLTEKLRKRIPRQQYDVPIQAAIGSHVIARETVKAFRKDVIAGCYGGDITRKKKLLAKQKEGKKRMKQVGRIEVPQEAFLAVLELDEE